MPRVLDYRQTLETALALVPGTRQVTLLAGASEQDHRWLAEALEDIAPLGSRVRIEQIANLAWQDVLRKVSSLPSDAVAIPVSFFADAQGRAFVPGEAILAISKAANRPLFVAMASSMGSGVVGGYVLDSEQLGRQAAKLVLGTAGESWRAPGPARLTPRFCDGCSTRPSCASGASASRRFLPAALC